MTAAHRPASSARRLNVILFEYRTGCGQHDGCIVQIVREWWDLTSEPRVIRREFMDGMHGPAVIEAPTETADE